MKIEDFLTCLIVVLAVFGILFIGVFLHELFHFLHVKGATAICLTVNARINESIQDEPFFAYTDYDLTQYNGIEEFQNLMELSEKYVAYVGFTWNIVLGMLLGLWLKGRIDKRGG